MDYLVEVFDTWGRRIAQFEEVPLLDVVRSSPDGRDAIEGLLPESIAELGHACRLRVSLAGALFCEAEVEEITPHWSDQRKLILDKYVSFHEIVAVKARGVSRAGNTRVVRAYTNREIGAVVKDAINSAPASIHYTVAHTAAPEGAEREYAKFLARKTDENELEVGGIDAGQWVGADRMDLSNAYAKDGDTIAGVEVDGAAWPDIRLMMIDCEETTRNSHAIVRHPEVADWSDAEYDASEYKLKANDATATLQALLDSEGIDYIELNPHRDGLGDFDDRVDAYGRYLGLVYGGGYCFNAALVEADLADVYLYEDGAYHVPEMALKEFYSYAGLHTDSVESTEMTLSEFDVRGGVLEVITALGYAAAGYVFDVDPALVLRFRRAVAPDRVVYFDPTKVGIRFGSQSPGLANYLYLKGNPLSAFAGQGFGRPESIDAYGLKSHSLDYFSISQAQDAEKLAEGLLADLAYPETIGRITFFAGDAMLQVGDLIELRGGPLRRLSQELPDEWDGQFTGKLVGRVSELRHRLTGKHVVTQAKLTSPLRTVDAPLSFLVRSQEKAETLFEFRLDDATVGLDMGFHLD